MTCVSRFFLIGMLLCCAVTTAWAQAVPETCDVDFQDLMRSRAWMEAQRETEVAETLILKPDGVLRYSCISDSVDQAKDIKIFSEDIAGRIDSFFSSASLTCETMDTVTEAMRCTDADKTKIFPKFEDLVAGEIRPNCSSSARNNGWNNASGVVFVDPVPRAVDAGGLDDVDMQRELNTAGNCGSSAVFISGIEVKYNKVKVASGNTGAVFDADEKTKIDGVCLAPGCYFDGSSCVSG